MISQKNPLQIDLVIENVVNWLSEKDLKSCRLVSTKWYFLATKTLQRVSKSITFGDLYKINIIRLRPDLETIKQFISTMSFSYEALPYVKFDLRPSLFAPENLHILQEFFDNFGRHIQMLSISLAYESADTFPRNCFRDLDLSNLKSLDFLNTIRGEMRPSLTSDLLTTRYNLLETLLNAAPNLETLNFWSDGENVVWPGEAIEVLRLSKLPYLRNLKVSLPVTSGFLLNLSRTSFQLTSFIFLIREPIFNSKSFQLMLQSQQDTLKTLKIVDLQCDLDKLLELPVMKQLTKLEIEGTFYGDHCLLSFINSSFKKLPKIETIILRNCHNLNFDLDSFFTTYNNEVCTTLRELHITLAHDFVNLKWIRKISRIFPNLRNLHVIFSQEAKDLLTSVFQYFKDLEQLTINVRKCGVNLDSVLTGVSSKAIYEYGGLVKSASSGRIGSSHLKYKPSLVDLTDLKVLEFKGEHKNYKVGTSAFTDASAYLAFLQMEKLRNLILWQSGLNLSQECKKDLAERFHFVQLYHEDR